MEMRDGSRRLAAAFHRAAATPSPPATPVAAPPMAPSASPPRTPAGETFAAETVPFVNDRFRLFLAGEYATAADYKAVALNLNGIVGIFSGEPSEEAAKNAALEQCQKRADAVQSPRKCEIYVVGNTVIYPHGRPPMPPLPWIRRDPSVEKPFVAKDMPLIRDPGKARLESNYVPGKNSKSIAVGPEGQFIFYTGGETTGESVRRTLESCGALAGAACMIVAIDDVFVVPLPTAFKVTGFFQAANHSSIAADARDDVVRKLAEASSGWNAVAVGASGRPGLALKAASEQNAVSESLGNCAKSDRDCRIIAIGPFSVGPN
jgi:adenylate cyclase